MKRIKDIFIGIIIGGIIFTSISVIAATLRAEEVKYTPSNENFAVDNAEDALNELYDLTGNLKGKGKMASINFVRIHAGDTSYTTGMTTDSEYFSVLYANSQVQSTTNTITINKAGNYRLTLMVSERYNNSSVILYVNDVPTYFTSQGLVYDNVLELNANDKVSVTPEGVDMRFQGVTLIVSAT